MPTLPTLSAAPTAGSYLAESLGLGLQKTAEGFAKGFKASSEQRAMKGFAEKLAKENPDNPRYQTLSKIYGLSVPQEMKDSLIKSLVGSDPWDMSRKFYLNRRDIADGYDKQIRNYSSLVKSGAFDLTQTKAMETQIQDLMKEREQRLAMYDAQFKSQLGFSPSENFAEKPKPKEEAKPEIEKPKERTEEEPLKKKEKFDSNNPKHIARREEVLKKTNGDKSKANQVLAKEFD